MPQLHKMRSVRRLFISHGKHVHLAVPYNDLYRKLRTLYKLLYQYRMIPTFT